VSQIVKQISYAISQGFLEQLEIPAISLFNTLSKSIELYNSNKPVTIADLYYTIVSDVHKYHTGDVDQEKFEKYRQKNV